MDGGWSLVGKRTGLIVLEWMIKPVVAELLTVFVETNPIPIDLGYLNDLPLSMSGSSASEPALGAD